MRTVPHDKDPNCIMCSPGVPVEVDTTCTLQKVLCFFQQMSQIQIFNDRLFVLPSDLALSSYPNAFQLSLTLFSSCSS